MLRTLARTHSLIINVYVLCIWLDMPTCISRYSHSTPIGHVCLTRIVPDMTLSPGAPNINETIRLVGSCLSLADGTFTKI